MITVNFSNVGQYNKSWSCQLKQLTHSALVRQIKSHHALMSQDIDFDFDDESNTGQIFVGGFRMVGMFTVSTAESA